MDGAADQKEVIEGAHQHCLEVHLQLWLVVPENVVYAQVAQQRQQEQHKLEQEKLHDEAAENDHEAEGDVN